MKAREKNRHDSESFAIAGGWGKRAGVVADGASTGVGRPRQS